MNARQLLLLDSIGAVFTFGMTALVLAPGWIPTGVPSPLLNIMAAAAAVCFIIGYQALIRGADPGFYLAVLSALNRGYAVGAITVCLIHRETLTIFGGLYFVIEALVLCALAIWEKREARVASSTGVGGNHNEA